MKKQQQKTTNLRVEKKIFLEVEVYAAGRRGVGDRCLVVSIDISLDKEKYSESISCIPIVHIQ